MSDNYDDMLDLTRPQYADLPRMSMSDRAAQFSPFAALVGYDDAVDETARLTDSHLELTEDEANELNASLNRIIAALDEQPCVRVTYFVPDAKKSGGRYIEKVGTARTFNEYTNELIFTDGDAIAVEDMCAAEITEQPES